MQSYELSCPASTGTRAWIRMKASPTLCHTLLLHEDLMAAFAKYPPLCATCCHRVLLSQGIPPAGQSKILLAAGDTQVWWPGLHLKYN